MLETAEWCERGRVGYKGWFSCLTDPGSVPSRLFLGCPMQVLLLAGFGSCLLLNPRAGRPARSAGESHVAIEKLGLGNYNWRGGGYSNICLISKKFFCFLARVKVSSMCTFTWGKTDQHKHTYYSISGCGCSPTCMNLLKLVKLVKHLCLVILIIKTS